MAGSESIDEDVTHPIIVLNAGLLSIEIDKKSTRPLYLCRLIIIIIMIDNK